MEQERTEETEDELFVASDFSVASLSKARSKETSRGLNSPESSGSYCARRSPERRRQTQCFILADGMSILFRTAGYSARGNGVDRGNRTSCSQLSLFSPVQILGTTHPDMPKLSLSRSKDRVFTEIASFLGLRQIRRTISHQIAARPG